MNAGSEGHEDDVELIKELAREYIAKQNCIILLTVACESKYPDRPLEAAVI